MREILFRGQTRRYGEKVRVGDGQKLPSRWVYGGVLQGGGDRSIIYGGENENKPSEGLEKWVVYADTLGQYTGLTDKNGKKIFEGDILSVWVNEMAYPEEGSFEEELLGRRKMPTGNKIRTVWSVEHKIRSNAGSTFFVYGKDRRFSRVLTGNTVYNAEAEVIGNIHDNPELMKGGAADG